MSLNKRWMRPNCSAGSATGLVEMRGEQPLDLPADLAVVSVGIGDGSLCEVSESDLSFTEVAFIPQAMLQSKNFFM